MHTPPKILIALLLVFALFVLLGDSPAPAQKVRPEKARTVLPENKVPGQVESTSRRLTQVLLKQGFEVSRGYFKLYAPEDCQYTLDRLGSCFGNNPAAPYVTFAVPPWPEESVDSISNVWGPSRAGYIDIFRLDPREAIIILAQLPPPARYFSEQSFVFTRQGTWNSNSTTYQNIANDPRHQVLLPLFFRKVPNTDPQRIFLFAGLSNPINNVVIERQAETAFNQIRYFIVTPDDFMNKAVREAFAGVSVEAQNIFTEPIHSPDMNFGLDQASDNFTTLIRYAQPEPGTASEAWRENLPLVVLRVRDTHHASQPYTTPVVLEPRTAFDEHTLESDLFSLVSAVHQRWTGQPCANADCSDVATRFLDTEGHPVYAIGPPCIPIGENCVGNSWDASYHFLGPKPLDHGEIQVVAGALGTETGNATYVGLGINQSSRLLGVANLFDGDLKGTADAYAGEVNNTGKFYLYYFTRDCSDIVDLTGGHCLSIDESLVPAGDSVTFSVRDYIRPDTERGPDSPLVLPPMVFTLQRP